MPEQKCAYVGNRKCNHPPESGPFCHMHQCPSCSNQKSSRTQKCETCSGSENHGHKKSRQTTKLTARPSTMGADKTNVSSRPSIAYPAQVQLTDRESFLMKRRHMSRSVAGVRSTLSRMTGRYNARSVIRSSQIDKTSNGIHNVVEIAIGFGRPLTELTASDKVDFRSAARLALIDLMQESLPALEENDVVQDSLEIGTRTVYVASFQSGSVSRMVADVVSEAIVDAPIEILVGKRNYVSDGQRVKSSGKVDSPPPPLPPPEEADEPERPPFPQSQPTTVGSEFAGHHDDDELPETPLPEHPEDYDESENELPPSPTRLSRRKESEIPTPHDNDGYLVFGGPTMDKDFDSAEKCSYESATGRKCQMACHTGSKFCEQHLCPLCGDAKSSHTSTCHHCHRRHSHMVRCAYETSPGAGRFCHEPPLWGHDCCKSHQCPTCDNHKAEFAPKCASCIEHVRAAIAKEDYVQAREDDDESNAVAHCRYVSETGRKCLREPQGEGLCKTHTCPSCDGPKPSKNVTCATCSSCPVTACAYETELGRMCSAPPRFGHTLCKNHLCTKCGGQKSDSEKSCSKCHEEKGSQIEKLTKTSSHLCAYESFSGRTCKKSPDDGGVYCEMHSCPICGGSKPSSEERCHACSHSGGLPCQYTTNFGKICSEPAVSETKVYCVDHQCPSCLAQKAGFESTCEKCQGADEKSETAPSEHSYDGLQLDTYLPIGAEDGESGTSCRYISSDGESCFDCPDDGHDFCMVHQCPACDNSKSSSETLCSACYNMNVDTSKGVTGSQRCKVEAEIGVMCANEALIGSQYCSVHHCSSCNGHKLQFEDVCQSCAPSTDVETDVDDYLEVGGDNGASRQSQPFDKETEASRTSHCTYLSLSGESCMSCPSEGGRLCSQHRCPECGNSKASFEDTCDACSEALYENAAEVEHYSSGIIRSSTDSRSQCSEVPEEVAKEIPCNYISAVGEMCHSLATEGSTLCASHLCPKCGQAKSIEEHKCQSCSDQRQLDDTQCDYVSSTGKSCKKHPLKGFTRCSLHRCPDCGKSKSSKDNKCSDCMSGALVEETLLSTVPTSTKCTYVSNSGRTCNTLAVAGQALCGAHACPKCHQSKSSKGTTCPNCATESNFSSGDGDDDKPSTCSYSSVDGKNCTRFTRGRHKFCTSHQCPQCARSKASGTSMCRSCSAKKEGLYNGSSEGIYIGSTEDEDITCEHVSATGQQCHTESVGSKKFCCHHLCPKCDGSKSSREALCAACGGELAAEGMYCDDDGVSDMTRCLYTSESGQVCKKSPNNNGLFCVSHQCPHCSNSKSSKSASCPTCGGGDTDRCAYISAEGKECSTTPSADKKYCVQHQCPTCPKSKSSKMSACKSCDSNGLCAYTSQTGRCCTVTRVEGCNYCISHQCPTCDGPKSSQASSCDLCGECAVSCAFTSASGRKCWEDCIPHHSYCNKHQCPTCDESKTPNESQCRECITRPKPDGDEDLVSEVLYDVSDRDIVESEDWIEEDGNELSVQEIMDVGNEPDSCLCRRRIDHNLHHNGVQGIATSKRKTTDPWTLLIFLLLCVGLGAASWYMNSNSDIEQFTAGLDSFGNICGKGNSRIEGINNSGVLLTDRPYLYYVDPTDSNAPAVCVKSCPYDDDDAGGLYAPDSGFSDCTGCSTSGAAAGCSRCRTYQVCVNTGIQFGSAYPENLMSYRATESSCPPYVYQSKPVNGVCWPTELEYGGSTAISSGFYANVPEAQLTFKRLSQALDAAQGHVAVGMGITAAVCVAELVFFRLAKGVLPYYVFGLTALIILGLVAAVFWFEVYQNAASLGNLADISQVMFSLGASVITVWFVVLAGLAVTVRHNVRLAYDMARETIGVIQADVSLLSGPVILCIVILTYMWYYLWTMKHTVSTQSIVVGSNGYAELVYSDPPPVIIETTVAMHSIGMVWIVLFLLCIAAMVRSFRTASKYFSRLNFDVEAQEYKRQVESGRSGGFCQGNYEDDDDTDYKVLNLEPILGMVLRYHVGTIALSALVRFGQSAAVLLLWCLHAIFEALARVHITTRCLRTVADVPVKLRRFLMTYVSKKAHLQVALFSFDFFFASWSNWELMSRNRLFWEEVLTVSETGFAMCKALASGSGVLYIYVIARDEDNTTLSLWIVMYASVFACWLVAEAFIQLYSVATTDLLTCFVEDRMWNDGSHRRPIHAADELSTLLHDVRQDLEKKAAKKKKEKDMRHDAAMSKWNVASATMLMKLRLRSNTHDGGKNQYENPTKAWSLVRSVVVQGSTSTATKSNTTSRITKV